MSMAHLLYFLLPIFKFSYLYPPSLPLGNQFLPKMFVFLPPSPVLYLILVTFYALPSKVFQLRPVDHGGFSLLYSK